MPILFLQICVWVVKTEIQRWPDLFFLLFVCFYVHSAPSDKQNPTFSVNSRHLPAQAAARDGSLWYISNPCFLLRAREESLGTNYSVKQQESIRREPVPSQSVGGVLGRGNRAGGWYPNSVTWAT